MEFAHFKLAASLHVVSLFKKVAAESFLYRKLRHKLFGVTADDVTADAAIAQRIDSLGFLTPKHLDIKSLKGLEDKDGKLRMIGNMEWNTSRH